MQILYKYLHSFIHKCLTYRNVKYIVFEIALNSVRTYVHTLFYSLANFISESCYTF